MNLSISCNFQQLWFSQQKSPPPCDHRGKILRMNLSLSCNFHQLWFSWQKSPPLPHWSDNMTEICMRTSSRNERLLARYGYPSSYCVYITRFLNSLGYFERLHGKLQMCRGQISMHLAIFTLFQFTKKKKQQNKTKKLQFKNFPQTFAMLSILSVRFLVLIRDKKYIYFAVNLVSSLDRWILQQNWKEKNLAWKKRIMTLLCVGGVGLLYHLGNYPHLTAFFLYFRYVFHTRAWFLWCHLHVLINR